jgi:diguanylate cyclase (GGDEF)-like protein
VFQNRTKDGTLVWEAASISPIRDEDGTITHFVGIKEDITEIKRLQEQLEHLARHDPLTGLPNRFLFADRLRQALAQGKRRKAPFAILYLDLDGFKPVNDVHGHQAGDAVLVEVGRRLQACVRESDTVARMGGDEFTVLLNDIHGPENARRLADTIVATLCEPFNVEGTACTIGASLGIALFPQDGATADALLSKADTAMYQAKQERA